MAKTARALRGLTPVLIGALLATACAQPSAPASAPGAPIQTAAVQTASPSTRGAGGEVKLLFSQGPTILNPHLATGAKDREASRLMLEPLAAMGPEGQPVAVLAAEVPSRANGGLAADSKTVTWKLKPGIKWSDNTNFTADDVVFTFTYMSDRPTAAATLGTTLNVEKVEARDPLTVVVTYKSATSNPWQWGVGQLSAILQRAQFKDFMGAKTKEAPGNQAPIGTGPYKLKEFKSNDIVTYEINPLYREANKPHFKSVQIKTVADVTVAARAACQTGDAEYGWFVNLPAAQLQPIVAGGKCDIIAAEGPATEHIMLNRTNNKLRGDAQSEPGNPHPFLTDLRVRQALAKATNRKLIGDQIFGAGLTGASLCSGLSLPKTVRLNEANFDVCKYDLAASNKLLDDAGWVRGADGVRAKGGVRLEIVYNTTNAPYRQQIQEIIKKDWESIGFKVELKAVPAGVYFSTDPQTPDSGARFMTDVQQSAIGQTDPDPEVRLAAWLTSSIQTRAAQFRGTNWERYSNPVYDSTFAELQKEVDPAKRTALILKLNEILVTDVVFIPIASYLRPVSAKAKTLKGLVPNVWEVDVWNIADWTN